MRLNPAEIPVYPAIEHVEFAGARVPEHERAGIAQIHQHHGVGHARLGNIDPCFRNDGGVIGTSALFFGRRGEDGVSRILDIGLRGVVHLMVLQAIGVAAQLLFDPVSGAVERHLGPARAVRRLEHHALDDGRDDVAREVVVRPAAEGDVRADRPREIFLGDLCDPALGMLTQRLAGIDLMPRDPDVHLAEPPQMRCRPLRTGPNLASTGRGETSPERFDELGDKRAVPLKFLRRGKMRARGTQLTNGHRPVGGADGNTTRFADQPEPELPAAG
jgi:hypothetical protein